MSSQNTLPLSEPMFAGITQHRGRSIQIHVYFMFTILTCTIEFTLCRSDLLDLILSSLSLSTLMPLGILKPLLIVLWLSVALNCSSRCCHSVKFLVLQTVLVSFLIIHKQVSKCLCCLCVIWYF
jgi:hypothetical protein